MCKCPPCPQGSSSTLTSHGCFIDVRAEGFNGEPLWVMITLLVVDPFTRAGYTFLEYMNVCILVTEYTTYSRAVDIVILAIQCVCF